MRLIRSAAWSTLLILILAGGFACTSGGNRPVLHLYTSLDSQEAPVYIQAFEKETGTEVKWVRLSAGEALARLEAEKNNPQVSVWFGGPSPEYIVAQRKGLLEAYESPNAKRIDSRLRAPGWEWTGFYFGAIGFACNDEWFKKKGIPCPTSWEELLRPELKSQISVAFPYTSGTAYIVVASLLRHFGQKKGWEYIRKLDQQVHHYNSSGTAAITQAGLGEIAVGIAFSHDILKKGKASGYPVSLSIPKEGTGTETGAVALVKGAPQAELGRKFIDWLLSKSAQDLLQQFYRVPLHPEAKVAEGAVTASQVKLIDLNPEKAADQQKAILAEWRNATGR